MALEMYAGNEGAHSEFWDGICSVGGNEGIDRYDSVAEIVLAGRFLAVSIFARINSHSSSEVAGIRSLCFHTSLMYDHMRLHYESASLLKVV